MVGAYALAAHGFVRATNDLDVWVRPTPENARRVHGALTDFGAPADRFTLQDFTQSDVVVQLGVPPVRIDILTSISGVRFEDAWKNRMTVTLDGVEVSILGREQLIANKRASGREKDRMDLDWLEGGATERG